MRSWRYEVLSLLFLTLNVHAYTGFGICNYGKQTVAAVVCYGPTVLKETTVTGNVKVAGSLKASNISVQALTVAGSADIDHSTVNGPVDIIGNFAADDVTFNQGMIIEASSITLNHSMVKSAVIVNAPVNKPYLKVQCGTTIAGSVTFKGVAGVIQVTDDSMVQGKIINGSLEFVKVKCA